MANADTPLDCVTRLRQVADRLRTGVSGDAGQWLAACLDAYLANARDGVTLEDAIGVKVDGGEAWWAAEDRKRRDDAVAEYVARCLGDPGHEIRLYERGRWRSRDRQMENMPPAYAGTPRELLFRALRANESVAPGRMPSSPAYLKRVLASHSAATKKAVHGVGLSVTDRSPKIKIAKG